MYRVLAEASFLKPQRYLLGEWVDLLDNQTTDVALVLSKIPLYEEVMVVSGNKCEILPRGKADAVNFRYPFNAIRRGFRHS